MNRTAVVAGVALLSSACGGDGTRVAIEPNQDADLRIIVTASSRGTKNAVALTRDEVFRLPIDDVASGSSTLKVAVIAYDRAELDAAFPGLSKVDLATLKAELHPAPGAPAAGAYAPPLPLRALRADVVGGGTSAVTYAERPFDTIMADPDLAFVFRVSAARACPPGSGALRAFTRDEVSTSCSFQRDESCAWEIEAPCRARDTIFGRALGDAPKFREVPGALLIEPLGLTCPRVARAADLRVGESTAFECPGTFVSVQETPRLADGSPWRFVPEDGPLVLRYARPVAARVFATGTMLAYQNGSEVVLDILEVDDQGADAVNHVRTRRPGGFSDLTLPLGTSALLGLSANPPSSYVVADAGSRAFVLESRPEVEGGALANTFFASLVPDGIPAPPQARGPLTVGSGTVLYWPTTSGLAVYTTSNLEAPVSATPRGTVTFPGSGPVSIAFDRGTERATVWTETGEVFLFDAQANVVLSDCRLVGPIAALPGRRLITRPDRFRLAVYDLTSAEGVRSCDGLLPSKEFAIPPIMEALDGQLELDTTSYLGGDQTETLLFRYGNFGGMLDLNTGLSQIAPLASAPRSSVLIRGRSESDAWALFPPTLGTTMELFAVPTRAPTLGR